jgi:uncharacterized protein YbbC (DUF1343 family)
MRTLLCCLLAAATAAPLAAQRGVPRRDTRVRPGITVLLEDSVHLVRAKRVALITNHTGQDESGRSDVDLLTTDRRARDARVRLTVLFSPEHGIRGTEDRTGIADGRDEKSGLPVYSLYTDQTIPPPDSLLAGIQVLLFDLQDVGTRTWTYVGAMVYAMRTAARIGIPFVVLDRPNPITGSRAEGPVLDAALANPDDPAPGKPGLAYALAAAPLRHGLTMGELAKWFNAEFGINAELHVIPVRNWERRMWFDQTRLPWVPPSPNLPTLPSALLYPALVAFEATTVSVGRGTDQAFQRFGAPWLDAKKVADLLADRDLPGVRFRAEEVTPRNPGDRKYDGVRIPSVRIEITNRERLNVARLGATLVWALGRVHRDSLQVRDRAFDLRWGDGASRQRLLAGEIDPDEEADDTLPLVTAWQAKVRGYLIYR